MLSGQGYLLSVEFLDWQGCRFKGIYHFILREVVGYPPIFKELAREDARGVAGATPFKNLL